MIMEKLARTVFQSVAVTFAGIVVWKAMDTGNPVYYGLAVAAGLLYLGTVIDDAVSALVTAIKESNSNNNRRG